MAKQREEVIHAPRVLLKRRETSECQTDLIVIAPILFTLLFQIHSALGLAVHYGSASVLAYLVSVHFTYYLPCLVIGVLRNVKN